MSNAGIEYQITIAAGKLSLKCIVPFRYQEQKRVFKLKFISLNLFDSMNDFASHKW